MSGLFAQIVVAQLRPVEAVRYAEAHTGKISNAQDLIRVLSTFPQNECRYNFVLKFIRSASPDCPLLIRSVDDLCGVLSQVDFENRFALLTVFMKQYPLFISRNISASIRQIMLYLSKKDAEAFREEFFAQYGVKKISDEERAQHITCPSLYDQALKGQEEEEALKAAEGAAAEKKRRADASSVIEARMARQERHLRAEALRAQMRDVAARATQRLDQEFAAQRERERQEKTKKKKQASQAHATDFPARVGRIYESDSEESDQDLPPTRAPQPAVLANDLQRRIDAKIEGAIRYLNQYILRFNHYNEGICSNPTAQDFEQGFIFFKASQGAGRAANYELARSLVLRLKEIKVEKGADKKAVKDALQALFEGSTMKEKRAEVARDIAGAHKNALWISKSVTSSELRKLLDQARQEALRI